MAKTTLSITNFLNCAKLLPAFVSILIRADHGVGKSDLVRELGTFFRDRDFDNKGFPVIDRRLSQLTEGDMVGLPSTDGEVTRFNPPDWVKRACLEPCLLFLDEINRATPEVMQAAFQLVLDRELNGWKLHPQTRVFAAVNTGASYTVNEMDPALLDRFWTIDLKPTVEEWISWARKRDDIPEMIVDFIQANERHLDPPSDCELGSTNSSRRSWHRLGRAQVEAKIDDKPDDPIFYHMCLGFVGLESTTAFVDFAKHYDAQVSGTEILNKFAKKLHKDFKPGDIGTPNDKTVYTPKVLKRLERMGQERLVGLIEKVADAIRTECAGKGLTPEQGASVGKFATLLPAELRVALWSKVTDNELNDMKLNKDVHKYIAPFIMKSFGVPMGRAGVGVAPNIPAAFKLDK
jgi:hypothetical protein